MQQQSANAAEEEFSKLKEGFMATISHELRTPLNGILGLAGALQQVESNDQKQKQLGVITNCAQAMLRLVTTIIDQHSLVAKTVRLTLAKENIDSLVQECVDFSRSAVDKRGKPLRRDSVKLQFVSGKLPEIEIDKDRLRKALLALIDNALKFTSEGSVSVVTRAVTDGGVEVHITDTGIGIDSSSLDRIFKAFEQGEEDHLNRKYEGLGLGLSLASEVVKLHGGEISVESEIGKGTTVSVKFPKDVRAAYEAKLRVINNDHQTSSTGKDGADSIARANEAIKEFGSGEILLVDPDVTRHLAIDRIFRQVSLRVAAVASKVEAQQYFRTHAAPDACILSEATDWRDLLKQARAERSPSIPIYVMAENPNAKLSRDSASLLATGLVKTPTNAEDERAYFESVISGIRQRFLVEAEFKRKAKAAVMRQVLPEAVCKKLAAGASEYCEPSESVTFVQVKVEAAELVRRLSSNYAAVFSHLVDLFEDAAVETGLQVTGISGNTFSAVTAESEKAVRFVRTFLDQVEAVHPQALPFLRAAVHTGPGVASVAGGRTHAPHFVAVASEGDAILATLAASSLPGRIHLSQTVADVLTREFGETGIYNFQERGEFELASGERLKTFVLKKKTTEDLSDAKLNGLIGAGEAHAAASGSVAGGFVSAELCGSYLAPLEGLIEELSGLVDSTGSNTADHPLVTRIAELEEDLDVLMKSLNGQEIRSSGGSDGRVRGVLGRTLRDGQLMELQEEFDFLQRNFRFLLDDWRAVNSRLRRLHDDHGSMKAEISDLRESAAAADRKANQLKADQRHADINRGERVNNFASRGYLSAAVTDDPELALAVGKFAEILHISMACLCCVCDLMSLVSSLGELWAGAITAWVLPELSAYPIFNAPVGGPWNYSPLSFPLPAIFELTAFNPALERAPRSVAENFAALDKLRRRIEAELPSACRLFPTFGFDSTGYREDGVGVGCSEGDRETVRGTLLSLGKEFGQGAIYEFTRDADGSAVRRTVPCDGSFASAASHVRVGSIPPPSDWTGGWKSNIWHPIQFYRDEL